MKDINNLFFRLNTLTLFEDFTSTEVGDSLCTLLRCVVQETHQYSDEILLSAYADFCGAVYGEGGDLGEFLKKYIVSGSNRYIENYIRNSITTEMDEALREELKTLQQVNSFDVKPIKNYIMEKTGASYLPDIKNTKVNTKSEFIKLLKGLSTKGYGIFYGHSMFKIKDYEIVPIENADYQLLNQLHEYKRERELVLKNTESFSKGNVASNVLLYGDAGTGKSTTVKTCAAHFASKGVRLIEFDKNQVSLIPEIAQELAVSPLRFIFFIDDLTFTDNDEDYYALKGILEGNVSGTAHNILVYATSNRRHLVKESMTDRMGDDLHLNNTLQETMSLSSRFGLTITFSKPGKDSYLSIVEGIAREYGLNPDKELFSRAEAFAIRSNGRSPRTAKQFIILEKNKINL